MLIPDILILSFRFMNVNRLEVKGQYSIISFLSYFLSIITFDLSNLGAEWVQEDVIYLKNIHIPRLQSVNPNINLSYLQEEGEHWLKERQVGIETLTKHLSHDDLESQDVKDSNSHERYQPNIQGTVV